MICGRIVLCSLVLYGFVIQAGFAQCVITNLAVEVRDYAKQLSWQLMSPEEYDQLQTKVAAEEDVFGEAVEAAQKEWDADGSAKDRFPRSRLSSRKFTVLGTFTDDERARERLEAREAKVEKKAKRITDRLKKKWKRRGFSKKQIAAELQKLKQRETMDRSAALLLKNKIEELLAGMKEEGNEKVGPGG